MSAAVSISAATEDNAAEWDAFVASSPDAGFFHRWGWRRVIERSYGHKSIYLVARRGGSIVGVLPLVDVKSALFGRSLISTAFTVGGGIAADDIAAKAALAAAAIEEGRRRRARFVELRSARADLEGWAVKSNVYASFEAPLIADESEALNAIPRKRRAELRKGLEALSSGSLSSRWSRHAAEFYPLYAQAMREHGTPVFPRRFADALLGEFKDDVDVLTISANDAPVLSLLTFWSGDRALPYYFAAGSKARETRAFDLAIWLTMRRATARGAAIFDFGRSKFGTGSFDYKVHWGFEPRPLEYQYALLSAKETPNVSPNNPKFARLAAAWRCLPLMVANAAGPVFARDLA